MKITQGILGMLAGLFFIACRQTPNVLYQEDRQTGALQALYLYQDTAVNWILRADGSQYEWVDRKYGWGLGHVSVNGEHHDWQHPLRLSTTPRGMVADYQAGNVGIKVERSWNADGHLQESYTFTNQGTEALKLEHLAINTPFNDNYPDAETCYAARCNAHIWAGGSDAYVYCTRMSGKPGGLGLILQEGTIDGYEVQERSQKHGSSNFRGVIQLNSPEKTLQPGESYTLKWLLFPADNWCGFQEKAMQEGTVIASASPYVAELGQPIQLSFRSKHPALKGELLQNGRKIAEVSGADIQYTIQASELGKQVFTLVYDGGKETSVECLSVSHLDSLIDRRCRFIAGRQQYLKAGDDRNGALIVYDNDKDSLYINGESGSKRSDCDEARERVGMGILLAMQYQRTGNPQLKKALDQYVPFIRRIQKADYTTNSTPDFKGKNRGYNYPWVADFWFTMFQTTGNRQYLKDGYGTLRALVRYFKHGFYCISIPTYGYTLLKENGFTAEADTLLADFKLMADAFLKNGPYFPSSEVNYEQAIVAPSVIHMLNVYLLTGEKKYLDGAETLLPLVESFGGRQPSFHLNDIAIRHWDGFWFGKTRMWGDTFPHYWSTLSGIVYRLYAQATGKQEYANRGVNVLRNNFCLFTEDGRGSCAYLYPTRVNGQKAQFYDAFANDQDWAMIYWLRYGEE